MKVSNLLSPRTQTPVKNQFCIRDGNIITFQSYNSTICVINHDLKTIDVYPDYNYSTTTSKYFKVFLDGEGFYNLKDLIKKAEGKDFFDRGYTVCYK